MKPGGPRRAGGRVCAVAATLLGALGAVALAGWLSGRLVLASAGTAFIPMAPLTALAFVALAIGFLRLRHRPGRDLTAVLAGALVCAVGGVRVIALMSSGLALPDVEATLVAHPGLFGAVPLARISPVTAAGLAAIGAAVMLLATGRARWRENTAGWLAREAIAEASRGLDSRVIEWRLDGLPSVEGDHALLRQALTNLIANAVKYTGTRERARIRVGTLAAGAGERVVYVRDNGVGFDMVYADKLFGVFQRLHGADEFEGTGIGLANVRRIIQRHGGRTWAEGVVDQGATFFVSLPSHERTSAA